MKILRIVLIAIITALGIAAGSTKVMLLPEEVAFFAKMGLNETMLILFGSFQLISAILFIIPKTCKTGAYILALTFGVSSIMIFFAGDIAFGLFSLLPITLILFLLKLKQR